MKYCDLCAFCLDIPHTDHRVPGYCEICGRNHLVNENPDANNDDIKHRIVHGHSKMN